MNKWLRFFPLLLAASSTLAAFNMRPTDFTPDAEVVYKTIEGEALSLYVFYPDGVVPTEPAPAIVFFHGGGFSKGNPNSFFPASRYLSTRGMVAISVQYRLDNDGVTAVMDGKSAMRYVRANAASFGIDPERIAAGGGSAGGCLAAAISTSTIINHADDDLSVSEKPGALVLFNPIYYAQAFSKYDQAIRDDFTPYDNISAAMAPALVMFGEFDSFVDVPQMQQFQQAMLDVGVRSELFIYENRAHSWYDNDREAYFKTLNETDLFLASEGFLSGPPTIGAWLADFNNDTGVHYPVLSATAPADGAVIPEWTGLGISADASDPDATGSINNVRIFLNGELVRVDSAAPYAWGPGSGQVDAQLLSLPAGSYTIDFEALDNDSMWAKDSVTVTVVEAPLQAPVAPTGLTSLPANNAASLDWEDNLEGDVVGYQLYRRTAATTYDAAVLDGIATSFASDADVTAGATYFYAVSAVDADGNESPLSEEVEVTITSAEIAAVPAASNAWVWKRNNNTIYSAQQELELNRGDWNGFARAAFIRFELSGSQEIGGIAADDLTGATLELHATATDGGDTIRVYGLLDNAGNGSTETLSETSWTGGSDGTAAGGNNLHESNRPDGTSPGFPPSSLTTVELGNLTFAPSQDANVGVIRLEISEIDAFRDFLNADSNGEITLILRSTQDGYATKIASRYNTQGNPVPTLSLINVNGGDEAVSDIDGNGIDDNWEITYFEEYGLIDGSLDSDDDGVSDYFEYLYGSAPTDAASRGFRFAVGADAGTGATVFEWTLASRFVLGEDYEVAVSTDLSGWDPLPAAHYSLASTSADDRTEFSLEVTHDYGDQVFLKLNKP